MIILPVLYIFLFPVMTMGFKEEVIPDFYVASNDEIGAGKRVTVRAEEICVYGHFSGALNGALDKGKVVSDTAVHQEGQSRRPEEIHQLSGLSSNETELKIKETKRCRELHLPALQIQCFYHQALLVFRCRFHFNISSLARSQLPSVCNFPQILSKFIAMPFLRFTAPQLQLLKRLLKLGRVD